MSDPQPTARRFIDEFQELSDKLLLHKTVDAKLSALTFLLRGMEQERPVDPLLYLSIVRRVRDQCPLAPPSARDVLFVEATADPFLPGPYAPRVMGLYRLVRMRL